MQKLPPSAFRHVGILLSAVGIMFGAVAADAESPAVIPIIAWSGPPQNETTVERYRELAEAGFSHNYSGFSNIESMANALDVARAAGVKQFISIPELESAPEMVAERFKEHPALAGYYLRDEPSAADFPRLAARMKRIQAVDSQHPCYINLFPNYATPGQLGTANYQEHLARFVAEVPSPFISFDHYPVVGDRLRGEWYANLEMVRDAALAVKKPFWAFALAVAHDPYPIATVEHLRLQAFSNLAYGAQAIQYFTYWTVKSPHWNFHEAPIGLDGKRTAVYERVKQVNREIQSYASVFRDAQVITVGHTGALPSGTKAYQPAPPVERLQIDGTGGVVSLLQKENRRFLAIVNRDLKVPMTLTVKFDGSAAVAEFGKDGAAKSISGPDYSMRVKPGDMVVLGWPRR